MKESDITVGMILKQLEAVAPVELAAEWDNIGLLVGSPDLPVKKVLITLDATMEAVEQAVQQGCEMIITHHPLIFSPITTVRDDLAEQAVIASLIRANISLAAAHTNLDAAPGGVADALAKSLDLENIGLIDSDLYARAGTLPKAMKLQDLRQFVTRKLGSSGCRINTASNPEISRVAVFPGSFPEEAVLSLAQKDIHCIITGEIKHHVGLMLAARGIFVLDTGHDVSERVVLEPLARNLSSRLQQISFAVLRGLDYNRVAF